jgi:hypothetical protein
VKRKLVITGDSHARGCAIRVKNIINDKFEICGFVKLGSGVNILTTSAIKEVMNLTKRDVIVFWGAANDVSKNNSETGISHIIKFVKDSGLTNIIVLSVPHRYDLIKSCVNKEITTCNRKLAKCIKIY